MNVIRMKHLRAAGMCNREPRKWFKDRGFSWSDFLTNGISIQKIIDTGDPLALKVAEIAAKDTE